MMRGHGISHRRLWAGMGMLFSLLALCLAPFAGLPWAAVNAQMIDSSVALEAPLAVTPAASLDVPATSMIGEGFSFTVTFDNTGAGAEVGYGPYVDLFLPIGGVDGTSSGGPNDGVSFASATYLGAAVNSVTLACAPGGTITHPLTGLTVTCPPLPPGFDASFTWQFVNLELPFGSFAADQPPAAITVNANLSNFADLGTALPIQARGGFRYGADPLDNPATDPPIIQGSPASASVTPTLIKLTKTYHGPEDETATGPNFPREYTVAVDIANGQTVTNLDITDYLPGNLQFVTVVSTSPAATCGTLPSTTTPGGTLVCTFASVTGATGTSDATVRFRFYAPLNDANGNPVIDASTGDDVQCINQAGALGDWTPLDPRDLGGVDNASAGGPGDPPEHILGCKSIAIQKSVANLSDSVNSPGDVLEYTLTFQVSDFFAFQNVLIDDLISDGQHFQASFAPTLEVNGNGFTLAAAGMAGGNVNVVCNYTGGPGAECDGDNPAANDGTTAIAFDISAELVTRGRPDGKLLGGCVPAAGGSDYDCDPFNDGATTATVKFRTVILDAYTDIYPSGDPSVDQGDRLDNDVTISGDVLNNADLTPTGNSEADTSAAGLNIAQGSLEKTIYAQNGVACPTQPCTNVQGTPGDTITYRLRYTHPTSDFENFSIEDFLPLPVFSATEVDSFSNTVCGVPAASDACLGPADTYYTLAGAVTPALTTNAANNTVKFTYGDYDNSSHPSSVVDLLFTVTIEGDPFADGLYLTNQARSTEGTTQSNVRTADAIVQIQIVEPVLGIRKGIIATDKAGATYSPTARVPANVAVSAPGSACPRLSGSGMPVTSSNLGTTFNSNLSGVDAGDLATFAIVVENTGRGPNGAFDVRIKDNLPAGYQVPGGGAGLNLCVTDGTGALFTVTSVGGGAGLLDQGIELVDPGPTNPAAGGLDRGKLADGAVVANGRNIAIVTFDLQVVSTAQPGANIDNTATLFNFAGQEGGPDFTTTDRTDTARTTVATGARTKYLVATSEPSTGAEGGATRVTIGEIVRYRLVWAAPEGAAANVQIDDNLPTGLTYIDDGTATMAFVSNGAGFTSANFGALPIPAIPGGCTVAGATADATTPATLPCTLADANVGSSNSTSADPDSYSPGTDPYFKFGTLTNDDRDADSEWIVVEFNALVNNTTSGSNDYNDQLRNNFVPQVNGSSVGSTSNNVDIRVSEPCIGTLSGATCTSNLNKVVLTPPSPPDAGGTVAYRVTYANASNPGSPGPTTNIFSTAFDVRMLDTLPAGLQLNLGSVTVTLGGGASGATDSSAGNTVDVTVASIPPGGTVQIDYSATILDSALAGDDLQNTANLTYTSLPGANGACSNPTGSCNTGVAGSGTGERTGSGAAPNDYLGSDPASLTIPPPAADKLAPNPTSYTIGEVVAYDILVTLPEGVSQNLEVVDDLPAGLEYVAGSVQVITLASGSGGLLAADFNGTLPAYTLTAPGGSGGDVTLTFGSSPSHPAAAGDNVTTNNAFLVRLQARVLNVLGNQNGTALTNNASVRYTDPESGVTTIADATPPSVTVVEPILALSKSIVSMVPSPPQVGGVATYRLVVNHAAGSARTAYDTRIIDQVPAGLTLNLGSISTTLDGGAAGVTNNSSGNNVDLVIASIPVGGSVVVDFVVTISSPAGLSAVNTANATWSTLPGADPNERSSGDGLLGGGGLNDYEVTSSTYPLAVSLASFTAQGDADRVTLTWETVSEVDNAGFNLYRAESADGPWVQLNAALIPSPTPGGASGASYQWLDTTAAAGRLHWYRLEAVDVNGAAETVGLVSVTAGQPAMRPRIWLPSISH